MRTFYSTFLYNYRLHIAIAGVAVAALYSSIHADDSPLTIGVSKNLFIDVSEADARIAIDLLLKESSGQTSGFEVTVYSDERKYLNDIREGKLGYFPLLTTTYLQLKEEGVPIRGANAAVKLGDSPCVTYLLLGKKGAYQSISEARGAKLIVESKSDSPLKELWLNKILRDQQIEEPLHDFFTNVRPEGNARKALLPVFFEQADLCLIEKESWTLLNELNPQLNTQLDILEESAPILEVLNCIYEPSVTTEQLNSLNNKLFGLSKSIQGRTLLKFTKVKHFVPFQEELLTEVAKLTLLPLPTLSQVGQ